MSAGCIGTYKINASSKLLPEDELNAYCLYHAKTIYEGQRNNNFKEFVKFNKWAQYQRADS